MVDKPCPLRLLRAKSPPNILPSGPTRVPIASMRLPVTLICLLLPACGGGTPASDAPAPRPSAPAPTPSAPVDPAPAASTAASAPATAAPEPPKPPPPFPDAPFPPKDFEPPHPKTAREGDGKWTPLGDADAGDRVAKTDPPLMYRTVLHPHSFNKYRKVTVAAIDLRHVELRLVAGTKEPTSRRIPASERPGLIPEDDQKSLLAVFNGGFQAAHGNWGFVLAGKTFQRPKDHACSFVLNNDKTISIGTHGTLSPAPDSFYGLRQTPPCLVEDSVLNPKLTNGQARLWAGGGGGRKTRRRSAVGLDKTGRTLFYAIGEECSARWLAEGMKIVGAVNAAQMDINWSYTRFLLFGENAEEPRVHVTSKLIPKLEGSKRGYVERKASRDFFYIKTRAKPQ